MPKVLRPQEVAKWWDWGSWAYRPPWSCYLITTTIYSWMTLSYLFSSLCSVYTKHFSLRCWEWTKHGPWCWAALVWDTCFCLDLGSSQSHSKMWITTSTSQGCRGRTGWNSDAEIAVRSLVLHSVTRFLWMGAAEYFQYSVTSHDTSGPGRSTKLPEDFDFSYSAFFSFNVIFYLSATHASRYHGM